MIFFDSAEDKISVPLNLNIIKASMMMEYFFRMITKKNREDRIQK